MRKVPQQTRAKFLVSSILQATEFLVRQQGIQALTTPKIAETAGVSVGSIYQYFDDKQQILDQVIEQKIHDIGLDLQRHLSEHSHGQLEDIVRLAIDFGFVTIQDAFNQQIILHWHTTPPLQSVIIIEKYFFEIGQQILMQYHESIDLNHLSTRLFLIINASIYSMLRYVQQPPSFMNQSILAEELCLLICNYLKKS